MVTIYFALFIAVLGALIFGFANGKLQTIGEIMFGCGLLVFLFEFASSKIHFLP